MKTLTISSSNKVRVGADKIKDLAEILDNNWYIIKGAKGKIEYWISEIRYALDKIESQLIEEES